MLRAVDIFLVTRKKLITDHECIPLIIIMKDMYETSNKLS